MSEHIWIITTTVESQKQAEVLAQQAVASRMAACTQVDAPITSHYLWEEELVIATEHRIQFKTSAKNKPIRKSKYGSKLTSSDREDKGTQKKYKGSKTNGDEAPSYQ